MWVKNLKDINKKDILMAGGKGASLGGMTQIGIPAPPGFVILSTAFEKLLEEADLNVKIDVILDSVNHKEIHTVEQASEKIRALIIDVKISEDITEEIRKFFKRLNSKYVAVRSSATVEDSANAAWAGQLESYLNTTEENLFKNIKKCWASLFTPRAIFYRFEKDLHKHKILVAVVIQKMVESEKSGVAFSVHPVTQDENQIIIEAGFGLGEAIVSGSITPDSYVVDKQGFKILDININEQLKALYRKSKGENEWKELGEKGKKQVLSEKEIVELAKLIVNIENHYGFPQDIEWTKEKGKFYILQSRLITTLIPKSIQSTPKQMKKIWIPVIQRRGEPVLMNSYLVTAYQDQYHQEILLLPRGVHDAKYLDGLVIFEANDIGIFEGSFAERLTPEYLTFFLSKCRDESDRLLRTARDIRSKAPYDSMANTELLLLFSGYSNDAIRMMPFLAGIVILEIALQKEIERKLTKHCQQHNIEADPKVHLNSLIFPQEKSIPSQALIELYELGAEVHLNSTLRKLFDLETVEALKQTREQFSEFMDKLDTYLEKYDFMDMEYYAGRPVTLEDLFDRIKVVIDDAKNRLTRIGQDNKRAEQEFKEARNTLKLTPELRSLIDSARLLHNLRQHRADSLFKAGRDVFEFMIAIGEHLNIGDYDAVIALTWQEISESLLKGQLTVDRKTLIARQEGYGFIMEDGKVSYITGDALAKELAALPTEKEEVKEFRGDIAFSGTYRGRVAIVTTHEEVSKVKYGDVLVSPMTDPYYVLAMTKASAIVTDEGGILSHAAIVSRELGIPCVIGTKYATKVLKDGDLVEVDADKGVIKIIKTKNH